MILQLRLFKLDYGRPDDSLYTLLASNSTYTWDISKFIQYNYSFNLKVFLLFSPICDSSLDVHYHLLYIPYRLGDVHSSVQWGAPLELHRTDSDSICQAQNMPLEAWKLRFRRFSFSISIAMGVFLSYQPHFEKKTLLSCQVNSFNWFKVRSSLGTIHSDPSPEITADKKKVAGPEIRVFTAASGSQNQSLGIHT